MTPKDLARLIHTLEAAAAYVEDDDDRFARGYVAGVRLAVTALREAQEDAAA